MSATDFVEISITDGGIRACLSAIEQAYTATDAPNNVQERPENNTYARSYGPLLQYATTIKKADFPQESLMVLAHAVYGWMPTILRMNCQVEIANIARILRDINNRDRAGKIIFLRENLEDLRTLAQFTNNSFVGLSKFLHFLFPESFAIWDSNILAYLNAIQNPANLARSSANNVNSFLIYESAMQRYCQGNEQMRQVEVSLFIRGQEILH